MISTIIHVAAEPTFGGLYQACARCSHVFQDYTNSQPMVPEDQAGLGIPYWTVGRRIAVCGIASWVLADDAELDSDEADCRPIS